jgi:hypothetical protein
MSGRRSEGGDGEGEGYAIPGDSFGDIITRL